MGLVGQNSMELTENGVSVKRSGASSRMLHQSTIPKLQGNDKREEALRSSSRNSAIVLDSTMLPLSGEGRKPCIAIKEKPALPTTRSLSQ